MQYPRRPDWQQQPVAAGVPADDASWHLQEQNDERAHWALRAGRWQGAIAVVAALLFWRFFLFAGIVALGFFFLTGRKRRSGDEDPAHRQGRRWRKRRRRKHRQVARRALDYENPIILDEQEARIHNHQAALAEFDRRLARASTPVHG